MLARGEAAVAARDGDDADAAVAAQRGRERAGAGELDLRDLAGVEGRRLGGVQDALVGGRVAGDGDLLQVVLAGVPERRARSTSCVITSWKRRWLKRPVSSSVTAWRCTVSCRSTFSTETEAWVVR